MAKVIQAFPERPEYSDMLKFYCPGCKEYHVVSIGPKTYWAPRWGFNEDFDKPTFTPSIKVESNCEDK